MKLSLPAAAAHAGGAQALILDVDALQHLLARRDPLAPPASQAMTSVTGAGSCSLRLPPAMPALRPGLPAPGWRLRERCLP